MKRKSILFFILLCCMFYSVTAVAENETQSPEEISQIQDANAEYERTHPYPKTSPRPLKSFIEMSTDGKSLDIGTHAFKNQAVVYIENDDMMIYHTGHCDYYAEKSNNDYSRPRWLSDVVMEGTRCTLCIPDELYYSYIHAVSKTDIQDFPERLQKCENNVKVLLVASIVLISINIMLLVCLIILCSKVRKYRNR